MERLLRPERLDIDPESSSAVQDYQHWFCTFQNFITTSQANEQEKLRLLINHVSSSIYDYISEVENYNEAVTILNNVFVKPINEVFARHQLATRKQIQGESVSKYLESLKILSKQCNFKSVSAEVNRNDCIRDAFIAGLLDSTVRQRLLESSNLSLKDAFTQARSLELAQHQSRYYQDMPLVNFAKENVEDETINQLKKEDITAAVNTTCYFCGQRRHPRIKCPAKDAVCHQCGKKGHFKHVCQSSHKSSIKSISSSISNDCIASISSCLSKALVTVELNGVNVEALVDTGSSSSFINKDLSQRLNLHVDKARGIQISMANTSLRSSTHGECLVDMKINGHVYKSVKLNVLSNLCSDIIIGHDILGRHSSLSINFGGNKKPLEVCSLAVANMEPAILFPNLPSDIKPIAVKSRRHSFLDSKFIEDEITKLLKEGIIEESLSPWRAQVLVVADDNHKKRMVVDYSQTINRYTTLDAFPLPRIDEIVNRVANYRVFSTIDLKSAYHQVPIREEDRVFTAFEACGKLFQFKRIPFGVTNGVPAFQRKMKKIIDDEKLQGTEVYLDDITIGGNTQEEHDINLKRFMAAASKYNLTINSEKSKFSLQTIHLLGYVISNKTIQPDPDRLKPLRDLPIPKDTSSLRRALGMFSHYASFIPQFSEKIHALTHSKFPLSSDAITSFQSLKKDIENAVVSSIDPNASFVVETDASERAIAATLKQNGRPVAFFSKTLSQSELRHAAVEKEAYAIIEAVRKWRHYLMGKYFKLVTDQKSVAFMFNSSTFGKVKNEKILRWRLELSCFNYEIVYRPGNQNEAADAFSRYCSATTEFTLKKLLDIHEKLCHPGETRLYHYIRSKNLAYSLEEIRKVVSSCRVCAEIKPRFFKHTGHLIKATQPFERLNIDFKGPLPSNSRNKYLLIIIDEYSRFPFAYPCQDLSSQSVIASLKSLFSVFGTPCFIHSDRGTSFMSKEIKEFLDSCGVASSRTTPYNPQGNGQAERYVGSIWKTIELAVKSVGVDLRSWEQVLPEALNSVRSLLCTSTNTTPHERMFRHVRRSTNGTSTPTWLLTPGPVLLKRQVRRSKYEPLVDEVTLLEANAEYAHVRMPDGRETTVSTRHLAPIGQGLSEEESILSSEEENQDQIQSKTNTEEDSDPVHNPDHEQENLEERNETNAEKLQTQPLCLRRSERSHRRPAYLQDYVSKL